MSGAVLPNIPQPNPTLKDTSDPELSAKVKHLDQLIADIAQIIASVNLKPSDDKLKLCYVDLKQAGLSMKVVPSNGLSVRQGSSATAIVSGGVPWYRGEWIGTRPPSDQVSMSIESGQGIFTISAKAGTPPNNYQLLILDSGQGREVINVTIENGAAAHLATQPTMTGKPARAASALQVNPKVQKVQQALLNKGIKTVKVNGKDAALIADGRFGEITMEAMRQFFRDQGASDDQIPKGEQLLSETARELGIE